MMEPLNVICRCYSKLLCEAIVTHKEYRIYRDFEPGDFQIDTTTTSGRPDVPWNWNIMVHRQFNQLGTLSVYNRIAKMRIVFSDDGAWLQWSQFPSTYLSLVAYVPRLEKIARRHFRHSLLEYRFEMPEDDTNCLRHHRHSQFVINGRGNYEYCSEKSMSYLIPDAIVAMSAFTELFSMTEREYERANKLLTKEKDRPLVWPPQ